MLWPGLSLLVVGDRIGAVFGSLVEVPLRPSNKKYQGTNSTFVFTNISSHPVIYRPTGLNRYFTLCNIEFLAIGGGSHFAVYLDGDLEKRIWERENRESDDAWTYQRRLGDEEDPTPEEDERRSK
ncbi:oxidation resistance protein 1 isoform X2 [Arachis hypogaea]|uniref:oxidation resistance protein 1 isoform X2 n=1 Tax=Arachis hypogaea TaxID=3818 RepID=UPI003B21A211